ncbi:MAG: hypothetical protein AAF607_14870 [Pseudomonadota bacterium]
MARRAEEETNHWPGFVDALSTIVMVITFLLILLGLTLFIMMQKVKSAANPDIDTKSDTEQTEGQSPVLIADAKAQAQQAAQAMDDAATLQSALKKTQAELAALKRKQADNQEAAPNAPKGRSVAELSEQLRQDEQIKTEDKLTILTRKSDSKVRLKVVSQEVDTSGGAIDVTSAAVSIEVTFDQNATKIDSDTGDKIGAVLAQKLARGEAGKYEIRSIASSKVGSVSEAQRKAYFRALSVRNVLIKRGISTDQIETRVSLPQPGEAEDKVVVVRKPL